MIDKQNSRVAEECNKLPSGKRIVCSQYEAVISVTVSCMLADVCCYQYSTKAQESGLTVSFLSEHSSV